MLKLRSQDDGPNMWTLYEIIISQGKRPHEWGDLMNSLKITT